MAALDSAFCAPLYKTFKDERYIYMLSQVGKHVAELPLSAHAVFPAATWWRAMATLTVGNSMAKCINTG